MGNMQKLSEFRGGKKWFSTGTPAFLARLVLGLVFIYAAIDKIVHPEAFAWAVYNYQILPESLINLTAIILPWLELGIALFLILGIWLPGAVFLSNFLLVCFFGALVFNLTRGLDIDCGCFMVSADATDRGSMVWYVIRDSLFLVPAFYLLYRTFGLSNRHALQHPCGEKRRPGPL